MMGRRQDPRRSITMPTKKTPAGFKPRTAEQRASTRKAVEKRVSNASPEQRARLQAARDRVKAG